MNKKHIVIFSHGFGVKKDSRGFFPAIASVLEGVETVMFDYNDLGDKNNQHTVRTYSEQSEILNNVLKETKEKNPNAIIDIISHSQGGIIVGLNKPAGIRKIILLAPPFNTDNNRMIKIFKDRPGTEIDFNGISKLARADGSFTIVKPDYWIERKGVDPLSLYNNLAKQTELIIINAKQDELINKSNISILKNIEIINIDGNHNFDGEDRNDLVKIIKEKIGN